MYGKPHSVMFTTLGRVSVLLSLAAIVSCAVVPPLTQVTLDYGIFLGRNDGQVISYLGVPFAAPPIGKLRYAPPQPPYKREGTTKAYAFQPACEQVQTSGDIPPPYSEDCLYMNIWMPHDVSANEKLPVVVLTHGGSFRDQGADAPTYSVYGLVPAGISNKLRVIAVNFEYRVNVFGFLQSQNMSSLGLDNLGLQDIKAAYYWVRKYISHFGGDNTKVTAVGHSAGSMALAALIQSNTATYTTPRYFDQVWLLSGGLGSTDLGPASGEKTFSALLDLTKCNATLDPTTRINCLRAIPATTLVQQGSQVFQGSFNMVTDGNVIKYGPASFFRGAAPNSFIPLVAGNVLNEGTLFTTKITSLAAWQYLVQSEFPAFLVPQIEAIYPATDATSAHASAAAAYGDYVFYCPDKRLTTFFSNLTSTPPSFPLPTSVSKTLQTLEGPSAQVYKYLFKHPGAGEPNTQTLGVYHGSELVFIFNNTQYLSGADEIALSNTWSRYLLSFVYYGSPNAADVIQGRKGDVVWKRFGAVPGGQRLSLDTKAATGIHMESDTDKAAVCAFWDAVTDVATQ